MFTRVFISYFLQRCHDSFSSEPDIYHNRSRRTFVNIQPSTSKVSKSIISLIQHYKWSIITMISGDSPVWNQTAESLKTLARENKIAITQLKTFKEPYSNIDTTKMRLLLDETYKHTRSKCT